MKSNEAPWDADASPSQNITTLKRVLPLASDPLPIAERSQARRKQLWADDYDIAPLPRPLGTLTWSPTGSYRSPPTLPPVPPRPIPVGPALRRMQSFELLPPLPPLPLKDLEIGRD